MTRSTISSAISLASSAVPEVSSCSGTYYRIRNVYEIVHIRGWKSYTSGSSYFWDLTRKFLPCDDPPASTCTVPRSPGVRSSPPPGSTKLHFVLHNRPRRLPNSELPSGCFCGLCGVSVPLGGCLFGANWGATRPGCRLVQKVFLVGFGPGFRGFGAVRGLTLGWYKHLGIRDHVMFSMSAGDSGQGESESLPHDRAPRSVVAPESIRANEGWTRQPHTRR